MKLPVYAFKYALVHRIGKFHDFRIKVCSKYDMFNKFYDINLRFSVTQTTGR